MPARERVEERERASRRVGMMKEDCPGTRNIMKEKQTIY